MQDRPVVPDDHVTRALPTYGRYVLRAGSMTIQLLDQRIRFRSFHTHDVVQMGTNVQVCPTRRLMYLGDAVPGHGRDGSFHIEVCEEGWGTYFSGMVEAVGAYKGAAV